MSEFVGAGVDGGEFDVEHFHEGLDGKLPVVGVGDFNLGALTVELRDPELLTAEADFTGCEKV
jgi:hypothetical protein